MSKQPGPQTRSGNSNRPGRKTTRATPNAQQGKGRSAPGTNTSRQDRSLQSRATDLAQDAAERALGVASEGASHLSRRMASLLDNKMADGVDVISHVARTTRSAADELEDDIPQVAEAIRAVAESIEDYAEGLRDRSVEDLVGSAARFTRRQPGLVFGVAAFVGFLAFRALNTASIPARARPVNVARPRPAQPSGPAKRKNAASKASANVG